MVADTERFIPELYQHTAAGGWQEARMDVSVSWPMRPSLRLMDISDRSGHA